MAGPVAALQGAVFIPAESVGSGTLRPGQVLQGAIAGVPGELELRVAGLRASLDSSVALSAGQIVSVTVESNCGSQPYGESHTLELDLVLTDPNQPPDGTG